LDEEEKSKIAGLAQENGFVLSIIAQCGGWLMKGAVTLFTWRKKCNKYDTTAAQYF
jgi:hypothetical protein